MGGRCLHIDQLQDFNVRSQGRGEAESLGEWRLALSPGEGILPNSSILCFCRSHRLEAGGPGDHGVTALGAVEGVSSSPPGTAHGPCPGMVASTVKAATPASVPATPRTAQVAQVRVRDRQAQEGMAGVRAQAVLTVFCF